MDPQQSEQPSNPHAHNGLGDDQKPDQVKPELEPTATLPETWFFNDTDDTSNPASPENQQKPSSVEPVSWTVSEFVEHHKGTGWYLRLTIAALILAALIFIATRDKISTATVIIAALAFGIFAARKPRVLEYRLDDTGLTIGSKLYGYDQFKSFAVMDEASTRSIYLMPMKRFMPALSIYYDHKDEAKIVAVLADQIPREDRHADVIDSFMHHIHF
jgi:hypothetical protein